MHFNSIKTFRAEEYKMSVFIGITQHKEIMLHEDIFSPIFMTIRLWQPPILNFNKPLDRNIDKDDFDASINQHSSLASIYLFLSIHYALYTKISKTRHHLLLINKNRFGDLISEFLSSGSQVI